MLFQHWKTTDQRVEDRRSQQCRISQQVLVKHSLCLSYVWFTLLKEIVCHGAVSVCVEEFLPTPFIKFFRRLLSMHSMHWFVLGGLSFVFHKYLWRSQTDYKCGQHRRHFVHQMWFFDKWEISVTCFTYAFNQSEKPVFFLSGKNFDTPFWPFAEAHRPQRMAPKKLGATPKFCSTRETKLW